MITVKYTNEISKTQGIKALVYGESGSGKTHLIGTAPNPIVLSAESGLLTLRKMRIPFIEVSSFKDMEEVYKWATSSAEGKKFDTICLDSVSEIAEVILADLLKKHKDPRKAYGETQELVLAMFRGYRDISNKHVYFSAKQGITKDGTNGALFFGPLMPGQQLGVQIPYLFDELFQLDIFVDAATQSKFRALRCQKDNQFQAKDRSGILEMWEEPHLGKIFDKIAKG